MAYGIWYYAEADRQVGPVSLEQLQAMVASGGLRAEQLVWTEGMAAWVPAGTLPALFPNAAPPAAMLGYGLNETFYSPPPKYAGFWIRFCAAFIDGLLLIVAQYAVHLVILLPLGGSLDEVFNESTSKAGIAADLISSLAGLIGGWLYEALMTSSAHQATLGKLAVGIKVTGMDGRRITFARATGRHFAKYISQLTILIGYIIAAFTAKKQSLHDLIASTLVVKK